MSLARNTFTGGLNQDIAKTRMSSESYLDANNMRLLTDFGSSTGQLQNVRGNTLGFTIPDLPIVYKISVDTTGPYAAGTLEINGETSVGNFTPSANSTGQDIYNFIDSDINFTSFGTDYNVAVGLTYIIIYSQTVDTAPVFNGTGLTVSTHVTAQANLIPIGFVTLRDDIYIYTTNNNTDNPGGHNPDLASDATSTGQIWKMIYDEADYTATLELKYNGYLDMSVQYPIPTTATVGVYETTAIQRIYWTDFFTPLRSLNMADVNIMAINPAYIDVNPPAKYSIPLLDEIQDGGSLDVGCYQVSFVLRNTGGATTTYSELSNPVFIVEESESTSTGGANFKRYIGNVINTTTNKAIAWRFEDLDTNFNIISIIVVKRDTLSGNVQVMQIAEEPIPADGELTFVYTGDEDIVQIDLDAFISVSTAFTHCKTIRQKDNRLFVGNVKNLYSDLDYDARAYSFDATPGAPPAFDIIENGVTNTYTTSNWTTIAEESDAINPDFSVWRFQSDGATLGGEGPNTKYSYGVLAVKADSTLINATPASGSDFRHTNPEYANTQLTLDVQRIDNTSDQLYNKFAINSDIKYGYYSGLLKGYQPGEVYRFGIQFFDKRKNPKFVKWIADIKMPHLHETIPAGNMIYEDGTASPCTEFVPSFTANKSGSSECFVNQLFVKFEINIPAALTTLISGYSIVRLERTEEDRTILGSGILNQVYDDGGTLWLPDLQEVETGGPCDPAYPYLNIAANGTSGVLQTARYTFDCPEFLLGNYPGYQSGDEIRVVGRFNAAGYGGDITIDLGTEPYRLSKLYDKDLNVDPENAANQFAISQAGWCDFGGTYGFSGGYNYRNYTRTTNADESDMLGSKTLCVELSSALGHATTYAIARTDNKKLLVFYVRPNTNQYGGNTYSARSRNEYILCSHFRPIDESVTTITDTPMIFGGDVFSQIYDNQKGIKNWGQPLSDGTTRTQYTGGSVCAAADWKKSITFFFPCYSSHNTGLRHGNYVNHNLDDDDGNLASGYETHEYNLVYSCENNIKKYYPKPTEFVVISEFDNRIYYSEVKINGETTDSWGQYPVNNFYDVDGVYGPINALEILNEHMICFQEKAVSRLLINPVSMQSDSTGTEVVTGRGATLTKHIYITTDFGTRHQHSVIKTPRAIYFIDALSKSMYSVSQDGAVSISEVKGMSSWFRKNLKELVLTRDNPIYVDGSNARAGITGAYHRRYNEVLYTIHDRYSIPAGGGLFIEVVIAKTLCFNELTGTFTSFYSFAPYQYIYDSRFLASFNPANYQLNAIADQQELWIHDNNSEYGKFYGAYFDSTIKVLVNPMPNVHKIFDNLHLQTEVATINDQTQTDTGSGVTPVHETFNTLQVTNDYQDTGAITLTLNSNLVRRHRYWKTYIPNDTTNASYSSFKPRIRDFYAAVELKFTNNNAKRFICHDILTEYRVAGTPITLN